MTMKLLDAVPSPTVVVNEGVLQTSEVSPQPPPVLPTEGLRNDEMVSDDM